MAQDFFDGVLATEQADGYRDHAATCAKCQRELTALAQLRALEVHYRPELEARATAQSTAAVLQPPPSLRWRWALGGAMAALAAMLLLWLGASKLFDRVPATAFYPAVTYRLTEGRSAHPRARKHLPPHQGVLGGSGEAPEALGYDDYAKLERRNDRLGLAAAHLARGTPEDAEAALKVLGSADEPDQSADVLSELAFAHLLRNDAKHRDTEQALRLADQALARDPRHGPALWNRALALKALGLKLVAAKAFEAAADIGEPGWSKEALTHAQELRSSMEGARSTWTAAYKAGQKLVESGVPPSLDLLGIPVLRSFFYDAVRARISKQEVESLLPLARELDARAGDTTLEAYVRRVASRDFTVRGPLAADYRRLAGDLTVDVPALLQRVRKAGEKDLLLGLLEKRPQAERSADELEALARDAGKDVWLATLAMRLKAGALEQAGRPTDAQAELETALRLCAQARSGYPCGEVELALTYFFDRAFESEEANAHARQGWVVVQGGQDWGQQLQFMLELAQMTRRQKDFSMSRAYYEEGLERDRGATPDQQRFINEGLANIDILLLRFGDARRHIDAALSTGRPLGIPGALALADIARVKPNRERDAVAMEAFQKRLPTYGRGLLPLAEHALGRWKIEQERQKGIELLRSSIQHATDGNLAAIDQDAREALAYSYTSLILDAGKLGDAEGALRLFEEEWRLNGARSALPERCLLAVTADDERVLAVVRGAAGGPAIATYDNNRHEPLPRELSSFLPLEVIKPLRGCPRVDVLARAPLYGRPGLLPGELAWSYRGAGASQETSPASGPRQHLAVQNVTLSPERSPLTTPPSWNVPTLQGESLEQLGGQDATPSEVGRRMVDATDITIIAHGEVHPESDEANLILAPEPGGRDALRASDVRKLQLRGHPLVVLVSCQAARPVPLLHEARSLPSAFLRAGARAVLAASDKVPERDGPEFFGAVRARIHAGADPAEALRAERADWLADHRGESWLNGVLLFE